MGLSETQARVESVRQEGLHPARVLTFWQECLPSGRSAHLEAPGVAPQPRAVPHAHRWFDAGRRSHRGQRHTPLGVLTFRQECCTIIGQRWRAYAACAHSGGRLAI